MCQGYEAERRLMSALEHGKRRRSCQRDGHTFTGSGLIPWLSWTTCSVCWQTRKKLGLPRLEWSKEAKAEVIVPGEAVRDELRKTIDKVAVLQAHANNLAKKLDCSTCRGWGTPEGCPECGTKGVGAPPVS